jgi:putative adenylate-forming enzyme
MDVRLIAKVLRMRSRIRRHEAWSRDEIHAHQEQAFAALRRHAVEHSRFYQRVYKGLESAPLSELPVVTKRDLMGNFDEFVTDPAVKLAEVEKHLAELKGNERYLDRYWVSRTAGSTGHPGIFLTDRDEWSTVIASYARAQEWAGIDAKLTKRTRLAVVSSRVPWHQSARVAASIDTPFVPVRRFDATQPLPEIVAGLNEWQPENLIVYASMSRVLAEEQLEGRLHIKPRAVMCSSEVLTDEAVARVERAWGTKPFNVYAATEPAGVASQCRNHRLHLFEDLVISEVVDDKNLPVPPGTTGAKVLVTVLFSRTQPLIRYEMSDRVSRSTETCDCGLPFALLANIEGRAEDILQLPSATGGSISVHPNVFHRVMEPLPVREWQVVQESDRLRVLVVEPRSDVLLDDVRRNVESSLRSAGVAPTPIGVELATAVTRTPLGKAPLVRANRH